MKIKSLALTVGIAATRLISLAIGSGVAVAAMGTSSAQAALLVSTTNDATTLGTSIVGSGITASGFTYAGGATASGTFSGGLSAGIGIDSGIILTTGDANLASGANNATGAGSSNGAAGDAQLTTLAGVTTYDASVLEFDFTTTSSNAFLNFVFASEEYPEYVNAGFNDVFAFYLDGNNIALVPGTSTPVSIDNVSPLTNSGFYNDNTGGTGIQYDGFTNMITASNVGLSAGNHHIKIAIADVGDGVYDSAIFLQLSSFADTAQAPQIAQAEAVPEPFTIVGTILGGTAAMRMRKKLKSSNKA
jgi:hypothetical protein